MGGFMIDFWQLHVLCEVSMTVKKKKRVQMDNAEKKNQ